MGFPSNPPTRDRPKPLVLGEQRGRNEADPPHQVGGTLVQRERRAERNRRERRETGVDGRKTRRVPGYGGRVESISKLRATLSDFSPANLFLLTPSLRKIHPPPVPFAPPRSLPLPLSFSYHLTFSLSFHQAPVSFLRSLPKVACSSRILISSKVLFPLNRAATRNNALYVRAFLLAFFFYSRSSPLLSHFSVFRPASPEAFLRFSLRFRPYLETSAIFQADFSRWDDLSFRFSCIQRKLVKSFRRYIACLFLPESSVCPRFLSILGFEARKHGPWVFVNNEVIFSFCPRRVTSSQPT